MNILYVFPEPLPLPKARGIQVVNTVHALARQGTKVTLAYVPVPGQHDPFQHYGLECPENVELLPLSRGLLWPLHHLHIHSNKLFFKRLHAKLKEKIQNNNAPQAIFVRHIKTAYAILHAFPGIPLIYEAHEVFADNAPPEKRAKLAQMESEILHKAAAVIAISHGAAAALKLRYHININIPILPSGASLPEITPDKNWAQMRQHIVYAGSFFEWKGVQDLVAAAEWMPDCSLTLIGGDEQRIGEMKAAIPEHGARINFAGHLPHASALMELSHACIAVLPNRKGSVSEFTSPLKLFEYMAAGCAIVLTDIPVFREVLDDSDAVWVEPGNPKALAKGIMKLVENPKTARAMGESVRRKVMDFTWEARAKKLLEHINDTIRAH